MDPRAWFLSKQRAGCAAETVAHYRCAATRAVAAFRSAGRSPDPRRWTAADARGLWHRFWEISCRCGGEDALGPEAASERQEPATCGFRPARGGTRARVGWLRSQVMGDSRPDAAHRRSGIRRRYGFGVDRLRACDSCARSLRGDPGGGNGRSDDTQQLPSINEVPIRSPGAAALTLAWALESALRAMASFGRVLRFVDRVAGRRASAPAVPSGPKPLQPEVARCGARAESPAREEPRAVRDSTRVSKANQAGGRSAPGASCSRVTPLRETLPFQSIESAGNSTFA